MHLKMLLWKDFRQQRGFLAGAIISLLIPYVIALGAHLTYRLRALEDVGSAVVITGGQAVSAWYRFYEAASLVDVFLSGLLIAFFAGNAIAGERADRSAEFFAYQPLSKRSVLLSKFLVSAGLSAAVLGVCVVGMWAYPWVSGGPIKLPSAEENATFFATCLAMFGVAWGVSSFVRSASYAAAAGVCVPICLGVMLALIFEGASGGESSTGASYSVVAGVVGLASFASGTVYYVRRVEP